MREPYDDPRLVPPEKRYEGPLLGALRRVASVGMFLAYLAMILFIFAKLGIFD